MFILSPPFIWNAKNKQIGKQEFVVSHQAPTTSLQWIRAYLSFKTIMQEKRRDRPYYGAEKKN